MVTEESVLNLLTAEPVRKACSVRLKHRQTDIWIDRDGEEFNGDYKDCASQVCLTVVTLVLCFSQLFITTTKFSDSLSPLGNKMRMSGQ